MLTGGGAEDQTHTHRGTGQKTKTTNMKKNKLTKTNLKELPLRPYPGYILVTRNRKAFVRAAKELFDEDEDLTGKCGGSGQAGACRAGLLGAEGLPGEDRPVLHQGRCGLFGQRGLLIWPHRKKSKK